MAFRGDIHRIEQLGRPPEVHTILPVFTLPKTLGADSSSPIKTYSHYGNYRHFDLHYFIAIGLKSPYFFSVNRLLILFVRYTFKLLLVHDLNCVRIKLSNICCY